MHRPHAQDERGVLSLRDQHVRLLRILTDRETQNCGARERHDYQLYRAMDFLLEAYDDVRREVFWGVKNLFSLEVDLPFVDTSSAFFGIDGEDLDEVCDDNGAGDAGAEPGLWKRGYSKHTRSDLAQVVFRFAVLPNALLDVSGPTRSSQPPPTELRRTCVGIQLATLARQQVPNI